MKWNDVLSKSRHFKVHIFCQSNLQWRFRKILWPSQNIWTLNHSLLEFANIQHSQFRNWWLDSMSKTLSNFDLEKNILTFGNAFWSNKTSNKLGMTLGVLQIRNMMVIPIEAFVILASLFRTRLSPPWCILRPSLPRKIPWELGRLWFRALLKPGFL